jgi:hypothetical protein
MDYYLVTIVLLGVVILWIFGIALFLDLRDNKKRQKEEMIKKKVVQNEKKRTLLYRLRERHYFHHRKKVAFRTLLVRSMHAAGREELECFKKRFLEFTRTRRINDG